MTSSQPRGTDQPKANGSDHSKAPEPNNPGVQPLAQINKTVQPISHNPYQPHNVRPANVSPRTKTLVLGVTGLVFGIASVLFSFLQLIASLNSSTDYDSTLDTVSFILAVCGIVVSCIGIATIKRTDKQQRNGIALAITGLVISILGLFSAGVMALINFFMFALSILKSIPGNVG